MAKPIRGRSFILTVDGQWQCPNCGHTHTAQALARQAGPLQPTIRRETIANVDGAIPLQVPNSGWIENEL